MLCLSWGVNVAPADDATASALHGLELVLPEGRWEDTTALEVNTDILADQWRAAVSWSGVEGWRSGALPLPVIVKLEMQDTYGGRNMTDVRDVYLIVTALF
jgi:hypothetical protein